MTKTSAEQTKTYKPGIRGYVFCYMLIFSVILLVVLWLPQVVYLGQIYRALKTQDSYRLMSEVTQEVAKTGASRQKLDALSEEFDSRILILNGEGVLVYSSSDMFTTMTALAEAPAYIREANQNGGEFLIYVSGDAREEGIPKVEAGRKLSANAGQESLIYSKIVTSNGTVLFVILTTLLTPVEATVRTIRVILLYVSIVMILVSLVIATVLSSKLSNPIRKMSEGAAALAKSDYSVRFPESGINELSTLSDTLNYATEELQKTDRLQMELVANVSHDLRTPLTMIKGYAEVMQDIPGENTRENLQVIVDETERLTGLVNDLLETSRMQADMEKLHRSEYNITASIESVLKRYNKLIENEGYIVEFQPAGDVFVSADEEKIFQVIYNLINNAINYTGDDQKVTVSESIGRKAFKDGEKQCVTILVKDSGEGIPAAEIPYVWERYYRSNESHKRAKIGSGIGLSIVRACLELHGALYGVESTENAGSTFWFSLPLSREIPEGQ